MPRRRAQKRRDAALLCAAVMLQCRAGREWPGVRALTHMHRVCEGSGRGYGAPGHARQVKERIAPRPVWETWRKRDDATFRAQTLMDVDEFAELVESLRDLEPVLETVATKLSFENKLLMLILWLVHYPKYSELGQLFGCTPPVCSAFFDTALLVLAARMTRSIPNRVGDAQTPSQRTVAVIDSVLHAQLPNTGDPLEMQWSARRCVHGMATHLLVDNDGQIASFVTAVAPSAHESEAARHFDSFKWILDGRYVMGDTSLYNGVPYVVPVPEHALPQCEREAKQFVRACKVLSEENRFAHSRDKHIECVFIVSGWYNELVRQRNK